MGRRRGKAQMVQKRTWNVIQQRRKRRVRGRSYDLTCPKCHDSKMTPMRLKHCIGFSCKNCGLNVLLPKHPVIQLVDQYNQLCDYIWTGKEPVYHYASLQKKVYEHLLKHMTLGTIIVGKVIG